MCLDVQRSFVLGLVVAGGVAEADVVVRNAAATANVAATRTQWLGDCGVGAPTYLVDFESGFVDQQNVSGISGLFPGGLVITDTTASRSARVRTGPTIGGTLPNGTFGLAHNEGAYLEMTFPAPGVEGFALADIDHTGTAFRVHHTDGTISTFSIETTSSGGRTGEFVGVWRNDRPPIVRVQMDSSGDGTWGIDDIQWIVGCHADFNGDGFLDFFDYDDYVNCFETGTCPPGRTADFNGDGFADFFDYDAFVAAFEAGC
jgi:hypothetical protein